MCVHKHVCFLLFSRHVFTPKKSRKKSSFSEPKQHSTGSRHNTLVAAWKWEFAVRVSSKKSGLLSGFHYTTIIALLFFTVSDSLTIFLSSRLASHVTVSKLPYSYYFYFYQVSLGRKKEREGVVGRRREVWSTLNRLSTVQYVLYEYCILYNISTRRRVCTEEWAHVLIVQ